MTDTPEARCALCGERLSVKCISGASSRHVTWTSHATEEIRVDEEMGWGFEHHGFVPTRKSERER